MQHTAFKANADTIAVGNACIAEFDVFDQETAIANDPDGFTSRVFAIGNQHRPLAAAANGELFLHPYGNIAPVFSGHDEYGIAILGHARSIGNAGNALVGADQDNCGRGSLRGKQEYNEQKAFDDDGPLRISSFVWNCCR